MMRPLSPAQARECEMAVNPECVCRCGGVAHGRGRISDAAAMDTANVTAVRESFQALPADDPHHLPTRAESRLAAAARKTARRAHAYHTAGDATILSIWSGGYHTVPCPACVFEGRPVVMPPAGRVGA